ncbi:hypothetical protein ACFSQD_17850 [Flavihumibacter stibioxidans]|uniref:DUF3857 domain-containing protein n=1 Tax=Flavihumibacter stibioxidans TaxID=1834163 RepID=A0ABR7MCL1_9BACT|nr:hypothetical protein [Flavihumibacter stibioxidans]MBC6492712.1 hypothetical protein [Flavihumibacter stibioxidans]
MRPITILVFLVLQILPSGSRTLAGLSPDNTSQAKEVKPLFQSEEPIELVLSAYIDKLWKDRGEDPQYHPVAIGLRDSSGQAISLPARARVRGNFRKQKNVCINPPILLNLDKEAKKKGTIMAGQNKLKLVLPCRGEELVMREYLLYRVYQLLTPLSLRARLTRVVLVDSATGSVRNTLTGMLLEPPEQAAARNGLIAIDQNGLRAEYLAPSDFHLMAVFQFFAANTDWGIQFQHNIELVAPAVDFPVIPIPYDFDMSGMVNAPYAMPPENLDLPSVRVRRYRGYCLDSLALLQPAIRLFNEKRQEIESLYRQSPGLSEQYRKKTLDFIDDFYKVINTPKKAFNAFNYPCLEAKSGNVIIKGMKEN